MIHRDVVCPFCALGCDDLVVEAQGAALRVIENGGVACRAQFERPAAGTRPRVAGREATLEEAIAEAARLLGASRAPLIGGLGTDTDGVRAALALAERVGAAVDHAGAGAALANLRVMQDGGWVTATLAELRNRADLVVFFGTDGSALMPRLYDRVIWPRTRLPGMPAGREIVYVGNALDPGLGRSPEGREALHLPCPTALLPAAAATLRTAAAERRLPAVPAPGLPVDALIDLAGRLREARYPVIVWAAGAFEPVGAELAIGALCELLKALNTTGRAAGFPLAGGENVGGVNQALAWTWGMPLRTGVAAGVPDHDPQAFAAERALAAGTADLLLWVSSFEGLQPPGSDVPVVALLRDGTVPVLEPAVLIPVGTPGLDHPGAVFRTDPTVALPLRALREPIAVSTAEVLEAVLARLGPREPGAC